MTCSNQIEIIKSWIDNFKLKIQPEQKQHYVYTTNII